LGHVIYFKPIQVVVIKIRHRSQCWQNIQFICSVLW